MGWLAYPLLFLSAVLATAVAYASCYADTDNHSWCDSKPTPHHHVHQAARVDDSLQTLRADFAYVHDKGKFMDFAAGHDEGEPTWTGDAFRIGDMVILCGSMHRADGSGGVPFVAIDDLAKGHRTNVFWAPETDIAYPRLNQQLCVDSAGLYRGMTSARYDISAILGG